MYILILVFLCFGFCFCFFFCFFFFFLYLSEIVSYLSQGTTLDEGTIIITGTPSGVGYTQTPPLWLQHGDVVECEIENIGILQNKIEFEHYQEEKEKEQGNQQDGTTNTRLISIGDENLKKYIVEKEKRFNVEPKMQYIQQSNKPRSMSEIQQEVDLEYDAEALANHSMFEIEYDTNYKKLNNPKKKETEKDQRYNLLNLELWELQDELDSRGCDIDHKKWGDLSTKRKRIKLVFYLMKEMEKKNETTIDVFPQKEQFFEKRTEFRKNKQKEQKEKKELKELKELSMQSSTSMEEKDSIPETVHVDNYLNKNTLLDSLFKKNKRSSSNSSNSNTDMEKDNNFQLQHTMTPSEIQNFKNKIQNNMINDAASKSNTISNTKSNTKPDTISNTSNTIPNTISNKTTKEIDTSTDKISKDEIIVSSDKNVKKKIVTNLNNIFQKYHKVEHVVKDVDIYGGDERREELAKFYRQENFKSNGKTNDPLQNANNQMPKMNKFDR